MRTVIYMGFNNPKTYKRGVENVIYLQSRALGTGSKKFYLFFDDRWAVFRWSGILCVGIPKGPARFFRLNSVVHRITKASVARGDSTIIHSHNYLMSLFLIRRTDLFTVHDGLWYLKKCFHSRAPWLFWAIERIVYQRVGTVHCNSKFTYGASQLPNVQKSARVIYCSTPIEHQKAAKESYLSDAGRITVFSVRSIEERARIDLVIEVAALALHRSPNIDFVIAGKGPLLTQYRQTIRDRGLHNIRLMGFISDSELAARYRDCDCVLVTCENGEGFGLPVIEGYVFGKPVVASHKCAIPEVIAAQRHLSVNAPEDMLSTLLRTLGELNGEAYFRDHYDRHFSNAVIVPQFSRLYDEVFSEKYTRF